MFLLAFWAGKVGDSCFGMRCDGEMRGFIGLTLIIINAVERGVSGRSRLLHII